METTNVQAMQNMMNVFYGEWQAEGNDDLSQDEIAEKYFKDQPVIPYAVALGNFNYQVGNGGISQWLVNDYAEFGLNRIIEILSKAINYNSEKYKQLELVVNQLKEIAKAGDPHDGEWTIDCIDCDGTGYYESDYCDDEDCDDVCGQCWGTGEVTTQTYYEVVNWAIEDNFDSTFYSIKPDALELFADIIAEFDEIIKQPAIIKTVTEIHRNSIKPKVQLVGLDGNVFSIIGRVTHEMKRAKVPNDKIESYKNEVTAASSYDEALQITMKYVDVY